MFKKLTVLLVLLIFAFSAVPAYAAHDKGLDSQDPVKYTSTFKVTEDGGTFKVGFAEIIFKKGFLDASLIPDTITVTVSAVDGVAGIEFTDIPEFDRVVTIKAKTYNGLLYDSTSGKNIMVHIRSQQFKVKHFSRYAFS